MSTTRNTSQARDEANASEELRLHAHFSGHRRALRTCKFLDCKLKGNHASFAGMAVDISRTGALVRVLDTEFAEPRESEQLMLYTARVWHHFDNGLEISFLSGDLRAVADVVRVTGYCGRGSGLNLLGIHFRTGLTDEECVALGIEHAEDRSAHGPLAGEPRVSDGKA
jgi:hypothetical protein